MKHSYTFPARSRADMTDYLLSHVGYGGWNHPIRRWSPLAWNVKVHSFDQTGQCHGGEACDPLLNDEWLFYLKDNDWVISTAFEDAGRYLIEGDYTTYPGNDQGDWRFCFGGRSSGWLILEIWKKDNFLKGFSGHGFRGTNEWFVYLKDLSFSDLRTLYRGVRCMDVDFTPLNARKEVSYQINFQRVLWEEKLREEWKIANLRGSKGSEDLVTV